jgi:hypothetical protein
MNTFWSSVGLPAVVSFVVSVFISLRETAVKRTADKIGGWLYDWTTTKTSAHKKYEKVRQEAYWKIYAASGNLHGDAVTVMNQNTVNNFKAEALAMIELTEKERRLLGFTTAH